MKFSEIWYVDASQQRKCYKKAFFGFPPFLAVFQPKNSQKTAKKIICQNPNRLMKFSKIWNVDASQHKKMLQKNFFWISAFFGRFLTKKQQKTAKKKKIGKIQTV